MTIIKNIKIEQFRWAGDVVKMEPQNPVKRLFLYDPDGKRKVGR